MKKLAALSTFLCWCVMVCAIFGVSGGRDVVAGVRAFDPWVLSVVAALAASVTLACALALARLPSMVSYLSVHLIGAAVAVAVVEGPRPPWLWRLLPAINDVTAHGLIHVNGTAMALLSVGLTWELTYACTWLVVRERRAWLALAVIVVTVTLLGSLDGAGFYLRVLSAAGLALVAVVAAAERRTGSYRRLRRRLMLRLMPILLVPIVAALVVGAWAAPLPSPATAAAIHDLRWSDAFNALLTRVGLREGQVQLVDTTAGLASFGQRLHVGGRFEPNHSPVLEARIADLSRSPYWRGAVYDLYDRGTWRQMPARQVPVVADALLPSAGGSGTSATGAITQTITLLQPSDELFTAGLPVSVTVPTLALVSAAAVNPAGGVLRLRPARGGLTGIYSALSLPGGDKPALAPVQAASTLAQDVRARALDLRVPAMPRRVRALARAITAGIADPYAQAWALQRYLRGTSGHYVYDTAPPQAPPGVDPTDYFLFTSRHGFCTYFASAMVLLARLDGIPARLVTGYAAGHLTARGSFLVTMADAHAWPELWIAGHGWLTFEPTPNFPTPGQASSGAPVAIATGKGAVLPLATLPRGATAVATAPATRQSAPSPTAGRRSVGGAHGRHWPWPQWSKLLSRGTTNALLIVAGAILLVSALVTMLRARPDAVAIYGRMSGLARLLRAGPRSGQTPLEWATQVAERRPSDGAVVQQLAAYYVRQRYGGQEQEPSAAELTAARASWRGLRRRWLMRVVLRRSL